MNIEEEILSKTLTDPEITPSSGNGLLDPYKLITLLITNWLFFLRTSKHICSSLKVNFSDI